MKCPACTGERVQLQSEIIEYSKFCSREAFFVIASRCTHFYFYAHRDNDPEDKEGFRTRTLCRCLNCDYEFDYIDHKWYCNDVEGTSIR